MDDSPKDQDRRATTTTSIESEFAEEGCHEMLAGSDTRCQRPTFECVREWRERTSTRLLTLFSRGTDNVYG
jgi:hypothetical protein